MKSWLTPSFLTAVLLACWGLGQSSQARAAQPDEPDPTFNAGDNISSGQLNAVVAQSDDKVVVAGRFTAWNGQPRSNLVRLNVDGTLDPSFVGLNWGSSSEIYDLVVDSQDRLYVCGNWSQVNGQTLPAVIRLKADGSIDTSYPSDSRWLNVGKRLTLLKDGSLIYNSIGVIVDGGVETHGFLKLKPDGTPDRAYSKKFADAGYVRSGAMLFEELPDGRLQLMGDPMKGGVNQRGVRFQTDGTPEAAWVTDITKDGLMSDLAVQADGGLLVSGNFSKIKKGLLRVKPDGIVDANFTAPPVTGSGSFVKLDSQGGIYYRDGSDIWKLGSTGAADQDFKVDFNSGTALDLAFDSKGRILMAGTFQGGASRPNGSVSFTHKRVMRLIGKSSGGPVDPPTPKIPETLADLANRVALFTAPNGTFYSHRILTNTYESSPFEGGPTKKAEFTRSGLPADQALLSLTSSETIPPVTHTYSNRFFLTFTSPTNGTYRREYTSSQAPGAGVQVSTGPFELSLTNNFAPRLNGQSAAVSLPAGANQNLFVGPVGFNLAFQWYRNGTAIPAATQSTYNLQGLSLNSVGNYTCVIANNIGSITSAPIAVQIITPPVITQHPKAVQAFEGTTASLSVTATGADLAYQWLFNGAPSGLPTTASVTISNLTTIYSGRWSVRVSNSAGAVVSESALLTVCAPELNHTWKGRSWVKILASRDPVPDYDTTFGPMKSPHEPLFTLWNQTVNVVARGNDDQAGDVINRGLFRWRDGQLTTLVFTNTPRPNGGDPFQDVFYPTDEGDGAVNFHGGSMYELRGGVLQEVISSTTPVPGLPGATFGPSGSYARRGNGVLISSTIKTGTPPDRAGMFLRLGTDLIRLADDTTDLPGILTGYAYRATEDSVNYDGTTAVFSTMTSLSGEGGVFKVLNANLSSRQIIKLADTADLLPGLTNALVSFGDVDVDGGTVFAVIGVRNGASSQNRIVAFEADGTVRLVGLGDYLVAAGPKQVYFGNNNAIQRWTDGVLEPVIDTSAVLDCRRAKRFFDVDAQGDDVSIGVEFTDGTVGVYANFGGPSATLRLLAQPQPVVTPETAPATFSVAASGPVAPTYQWRRAGQPISGATNATFTIVQTKPADVADYDVVVSSGGQSLTSAAATLELTSAPVKPLLHQYPVGGFFPVGTPQTLKVVASGAGPLTYQWYLDATPVDGGNQSTLTVNPTATSRYRVVVSNAAGEAATSFVNLIPVPVLVQQPQSVTVNAGGTATFQVVASGFSEIRYIWLKGNVVLLGRTNATLELANVQASDAGLYSVSVSGLGGGSVRSSAAELIVTGGNALQLPTPIFSGEQLQFTLPTQVGVTYTVERQANLGASWTLVETWIGDGSPRLISVASSGDAGFIRVRTSE